MWLSPRQTLIQPGLIEMHEMTTTSRRIVLKLRACTMDTVPMLRQMRSFVTKHEFPGSRKSRNGWWLKSQPQRKYEEQERPQMKRSVWWIAQQTLLVRFTLLGHFRTYL